jgi:hypothetical protein
LNVHGGGCCTVRSTGTTSDRLTACAAAAPIKPEYVPGANPLVSMNRLAVDEVVPELVDKVAAGRPDSARVNE